jgi:ADP-ribose pyrophosphatase YjhB (NUDIX family)
MDVIAVLNEIQTIARNGLEFSTNPYDQERYERLLNLAADIYGEYIDVPGEVIRARFRNEMGYITPKVGADAAIFNEAGEILLMDRADGSGWCLPCGWVDANEKPSEAAVREVMEETGLQVEITRLVGVFTRLASQEKGPHTMIAIVHLCRILDGELRLSHEGRALKYWVIEDVPNWHATHERYARAAYACWKSEQGLPPISD